MKPKIVNVAEDRESVDPGIGRRAESFLLRTFGPFGRKADHDS